jgi:hypothetical protein
MRSDVRLNPICDLDPTCVESLGPIVEKREGGHPSSLISCRSEVSLFLIAWCRVGALRSSSQLYKNVMVILPASQTQRRPSLGATAGKNGREEAPRQTQRPAPRRMRLRRSRPPPRRRSPTARPRGLPSGRAVPSTDAVQAPPSTPRKGAESLQKVLYSHK